MTLSSFSADEPCPKCNQPLVRRERLFFWRGIYRPGAFCEPCNSMWPMKGEEIPPLDPVLPRNDW